MSRRLGLSNKPLGGATKIAAVTFREPDHERMAAVCAERGISHSAWLRDLALAALDQDDPQ